MRGLFQTKAKVLAVSTPTSKDPIKPGPWVTAIASISLGSILAWDRVSFITGIIDLICSLAACSGITPPYLDCIKALEDTILDKIVILSPTLDSIAAPVSSQELSML